MKISCKFCGGSNDIYPDEKITRCAFCGSTIAIEENETLKELVLTHERDDEKAKAAFESFTLKKTNSTIECERIDFFYIPFARNSNGKAVSSIAKDARFKHLRILHPYGVFTFYKDFMDGTENPTAASSTSVVPADSSKPPDGVLYIPIYEIHYRAGQAIGTAYVVGETWQVILDDLPEAGSTRVKPASLKLPVALFLTFMALSFIGKSLVGRLLTVIISGGVTYLILSLKERGGMPWKSWR